MAEHLLSMCHAFMNSIPSTTNQRDGVGLGGREGKGGEGKKKGKGKEGEERKRGEERNQIF